MKTLYSKLFYLPGVIGTILMLANSIFAAKTVDVTTLGVIGDSTTLNTAAIQKAIDDCSAKGGCTLSFPKGVFLTGAIFLKKGVNLYLSEGSVVKGINDKKDYPKSETRIEGHFEPWLPALINADGVDNLRITGSGTFDGNGVQFWTNFWDARKVDPKVTNLAVERPRLMFIQNSKNVKISGVKFKDSGFWNLHIYNCQKVLVENVKFSVQDGLRAPSSDGIDIDSSQYVTVRGCHFRVDDDGVCLKGSKGPFALDDKKSKPVEHIRITNCTFERSHGVLTLGSEATIIRDVIIEKSKVVGPIPLVRFKLRPDTQQLYEDIHFRDITLESTGAMFEIRPWKQFFDLKGQPPPNSIVRNITISNIKGTFGSFGEIQGNPGQTTIDGISLKDIDVQLKDDKLKVVDVKNLTMKNVRVNGKAFEMKN